MTKNIESKSSHFSVFVLVAAILLVSCGGGGIGDSSSAGIGPDSTPPSTESTADAAPRDNLDVLSDRCAAGDFAACDALFAAAPAGSDYEAFGATCGDRVETDRLCTEAFSEEAGSVPTTGNTVPSAQGGDVLRMRTVTLFDPQVNNIEAVSLLVPETWSFNGLIEWRHDIATLASVIVQAFDPVSNVGLESYFLEPSVSGGQSLLAPGQNWGGAIVRTEMSSADYLTQVVIPANRPGAVVVDVQLVPEVASVVGSSLSAQPGVRTWSDAARVRVQYEANGVSFEEDFYTGIGYFDNGLTLNWAPVHLYSSWAPVGELDAAAPMLQTIVASADVSLLWGANYQAVFDLFLAGQYRAIYESGQLSRYLAQTADEIAGLHRDAYELQQATYDRVFDSYSLYTRGQDRYQVDGAAGPVLLPRANSICQERGATVPTVLLIPLTTPCPSGTDQLTPLSS